jgi:catechol 2,3-dioxygenase-like lactoylglutathione lyase family enzyme
MNMKSFALAALCFASVAASAQTLGILNDIHAVNDLEKTLGFYKELFGLSGEIRPFPNPGVPLLTNAPGVSLRLSIMRLPGADHGFELTDFTGVEKIAKRAKIVDPGAGILLVYVRSLDPVLEAAKRIGAESVTPGQKPETVSLIEGKARSVVFRDPDGYFAQAIEDTAATSVPGAGPNNFLRVALGFTMENAEATQKFYHDFLGFDLRGSPEFSTDPARATLLNTKASFRQLSGLVPGSKARIEFTEYKGEPRNKFTMRVRDPGAPAICLRVTDIEGLVKRMKAAGVPIISVKGELVQFSPTVKNIFVQDPNGLNIELYETFPAPATK